MKNCFFVFFSPRYQHGSLRKYCTLKIVILFWLCTGRLFTRLLSVAVFMRDARQKLKSEITNQFVNAFLFSDYFYGGTALIFALSLCGLNLQPQQQFKCATINGQIREN